MTLEPSQQTFWPETEFLALKSSPEASHAKTLAQQESALELLREAGQGYGLKSSVWLASYDRDTSSWRTSQTCLLAQAESLGGGLAEFSGTWPSAGMMRNGKTYQHQPWALPIAENGSGLWPTPRKTMMPNSKAFIAAGKIDSLVTAVQMWPTPTACMHKGSSPAALTRKNGRDRSNDRLDHCLQALEGSGKLNPPWVEWLMGYPIGHTDLQP
jgi:hypothetical protein